MDFPYIDSEEELELFTIFIRELGIKKIKGMIVAQTRTFYMATDFPIK